MNNFENINKVFIIAEIGGNHEGDFAYAKDLTYKAIETGVNAIKFQVYTPESLVNKSLAKDRYDHFKKFTLPIENYIELAKIIKAHSIEFMASIWNIDVIDAFNDYINVHKVGSGDLTAYQLIERFVQTGKPIILSTGLSQMHQIFETIKFIENIDRSYVENKKLCILQCTSSYPCPPSDVNLNAMLTIAKETGLPVGYSDHTVGDLASLVAVSMGATVIEKHFTDNRHGREFRDHAVSFEPHELSKFIQDIRLIKELHGDATKQLSTAELSSGNNETFRRALYLKQDMKIGEVISEDAIVSLRPNKGIGAENYKKVIGKKLKVPVNSLEVLDWTYFE
jgi:N-acetylneuraminate synthase/N,N'-diacetyllegionaminate synthase